MSTPDYPQGSPSSNHSAAAKPHKYLLSTAAERERANAYYRANRTLVLEQGRQRYQLGLKFVPDEAERQGLRADPRLAIGKDRIVCLECFQILPGMLSNAHLLPHRLNARAYKDKFGYSQRTALVSGEMA